MADAPLDLLLDAVAASLNAATLSVDLTAEVTYRPLVALKGLSTAKLWVTPAGRTSEMSTRTQDEDRWTVFVAIQQKVDVSTRATMKAMNTLANEVWEHLRRRDMTVSGKRYAWQQSATVQGGDAGYVPEHVETLRAFTSVIQITYMAMG